jgi:hypothetical protein
MRKVYKQTRGRNNNRLSYLQRTPSEGAPKQTYIIKDVIQEDLEENGVMLEAGMD